MVLSTFITGILLVIDIDIWQSAGRRMFLVNGCFARVDTGIPTDFTLHGLEYIPSKFSLDPHLPNNFSLVAKIPNVSLNTNIPSNFTINIPNNFSLLTNIPDEIAVDIKFPKDISINIILPDWIQPVAVAVKYLIYAIAGAIVVLVITTSCTFILVPRLRILRNIICGCFLALAACIKDIGKKPKNKPIQSPVNHHGNCQHQSHAVIGEKVKNTVYDKIP